MRYGHIIGLAAAAAMVTAGSAFASASESMKEFGQNLNDVAPMLRMPNMSGHAGRSHWRGHKGQFEKALDKRRDANVLARKARRQERLHRHTSTGHRLMQRQSA